MANDNPAQGEDRETRPATYTMPTLPLGTRVLDFRSSGRIQSRVDRHKPAGPRRIGGRWTAPISLPSSARPPSTLVRMTWRLP